jgi:hypothetical protein
MQTETAGARVAEPRGASSGASSGASCEASCDAAERNDGASIEFQPESGALGPCEAIDEAERDRDPREDL